MYKAYLKLGGVQGVKSDYELMQSAAKSTLKFRASEKMLRSLPKDEVKHQYPLTYPLLKKGYLLLLEPVLESNNELLSFDGLKRVEGKSALGDFQYIPLLFHETRTLRKEQTLLLELYGLLLAELQGVQPTYGIVCHGKEGTSKRVRLFSDVQKAQRRLGSLKQLHSSAHPPKLILNKHCTVCEFRQRCHNQAVEEDNISLLRGLSGKEIQTNANKGIFTLTQFAHTFRPRRKTRKKKSLSQSKQRYHSLQARAIRDKRVYMLGSEQLQNHPVHIYLDLEGLPEEGYVYLLGMIISDAGSNSETRHSLWADSKEDEPRIFEQFLDIVGEYDNSLIFCYGAYEKTFINRMRKNAKRKRPVDRVLDVLVNTLSLIYSHIYFPCHSNGLKDVGSYLGCSWTEPDASGLQSIVWRKRWEATGDDTWKNTLLTYNQEDCAALKKVTEFVYAVNAETSPKTKPLEENASHETLVEKVEESNDSDNGRPNWGQKIAFLHSDYEFVNNCGYFDYQRQKVYIRTSKTLKKIARKTGPQGEQHNRKLRVTKQIQIASRKCPECRSSNLIRDIEEGSPKLTRGKRAFDLTITSSGLKRKVIKYATSLHRCQQCGETFIPYRYKRVARHLHGLMSWAIYMHVENRTSFGILKMMCKELFDVHVHHPELLKFKFLMTRFYRATSQQLWQKILSSPAIHIDETEVQLQRKSKGYVWVFTTMEEVVYLYKPTREADFLHELLKDFQGVVISDFYSGYDSLACSQQKCLLHLMRDINQELLRNPYDEVLQSITKPFGTLLRAIVETVDAHGLKSRYLKSHERDLAEFFRQLSENCFPTDAAEELRKRLLTNQDKLFTFLRHDGVTWNNNNAEHAIKRFAYYRANRNGMLNETGLTEYLMLLSICETCRYKGESFLKFLLSREKDMDVFCARKRRKRHDCLVKIYPKDYPHSYLTSHQRI